MVKVYTSLLALAPITSLALAVPYPSHLLERDLLDASDDLEAREPSFFGTLFHDADKGLHVAEKVASNPIVQAGMSLIPGGGEVVAADKALGALSKVGKVEKAIKATRKVGKVLNKLPSPPPKKSSSKKHRRDLEDEELSLRELDDEELFGREYDDFLVERDFFDDLD